jgi:aminotransferase
MYDRTIIVSGFSKCYSMTGWRLGYACGHPDIIKPMLKVHQYAVMCAPTTSQYAAIEALKNGDSDIEAMKKEYNYRRRFIVNGFNELGMDCFEPLGAFYCFPSIKKVKPALETKYGREIDSDAFCALLLEHAHVALVPGTAFGECGEGFLRVSYAYSIEHIREALKRIKAFLEE